MSITIVENIILNIILVVFPLLVYLVLVIYNDNTSKKNNSNLMTITLITSLYLCIRFGSLEPNTKVLLFCNIPIVIAYMQKKPILAIMLSLANIIYCYYMFHSLMIIIIIKYISYLILYLCARKKNLSVNGFILSIAVIQGFFLSFEYFFRTTNITINDFMELIILVFVYYFVTFAIVYIFRVTQKVESLNKTVKLLEKDKMVKDGLFKLTHEIKNPLAVCKGYLDMINLDNKEKSNKYIFIMKQEINRSLNIMSDFMDFNKIKVVKEQIELNLLLEDIYDCFKIIIKSKNTNLIYNDREGEEIYFQGDYERLKQVIINLLKNSLESIEDKGRIELSSNIYKKHLDIIVEDNGIGMTKEELEKVTEMFYTTKPTGSGLGVALSNEIIKAHNGELIYTSEKNKGTKVTIRLPYNG